MTTDPLVSATREGTRVTVAWRSDVDMANATAIEHETLGNVSNTDEDITIDLSGVDYIDSAGIRAIIEMRRLLAERQQRLSLIVPADSLLRKALEVGGVLALLPTYGSAAEILGRRDL